MANKYVTEEAIKQIGKVGEARTIEVERGAIRRFAEAIGDPIRCSTSEAEARKTRFGGMIAPPTFCRSLGAAIPEIKIGMGEFRGLDGGSEWEYFEPIRPGDRITVQSKLVDLRESRRPPRPDGLHHGRDHLHQSVRRAMRDAALDRESL